MKEEFNPEVENTTSPDMNTQPVEPAAPVAPTEPIQPVEQPVSTAPVAPVEPVTPVAPAEPIVPVTSVEPVQAEPIQQTPLQPIGEEEKPKKKSLLPTILIIFFIFIIVGCLVYSLFLKDKIGGNTNGGTTTTTEATSETTTTNTLTDEEAKKIAVDLIKEYYSNGFINDNAACFASITGNISESELEKDDTDTSFADDDQCNGDFSRLKNYKSIDEVKNYLNTKLTSTLADKVIKKYRSNEKGVYCCLMATETSLVKKDSFEATSVTFTENEITFEYKYVSVFEEGGADENDTPITIKTSTDVFEKGVVKKDGNAWKIDSVTFVKNGDSKEEKVYE